MIGAGDPGSAEHGRAEPHACDACLRRTALIAALAGPLDVERKRREGDRKSVV